MAYHFNPHRHVKIWLSKDKDVFLNLENRIRLAKMREINPNDEIYFVYESALLSEKALDELQTFCSKYNIITKNVLTDIIPNCHSEEEVNLLGIYIDEITHLEKGGNVAVGSDILRWLKPVYELGTYSDFDVTVDTRALPETIAVDKPLLMNIGSFTVLKNMESIFINNDTIAVIDSKEALTDIQKIQQLIYTSCSKQPIYGTTSIERFVLACKKKWIELTSPDTADVILRFDPLSKILVHLAKLTKNKTIRQVRKAIIDITEDNLCFAKNHLRESNQPYQFLTDNNIITNAAKLQREILKKQLGWMTWLLLPKAQYKQIETLAAIKNDNVFLTKMREKYRMIMLKNSVTYTSGPGTILHALFAKLFYTKNEIDNEVTPFSFSCYGLDNAFISKNNMIFHESAKNAAIKMLQPEIGITNDLSWLQEGQDATAKREEKIIAEQSHMPQDFHDMREKIEAHIKKIHVDLDGCFGFYRYKARHAKIDALKNILNHFNEHSFDITGFDTSLNNYRSGDISASIGKSKTKELIDELVFFSQRAKDYLLTDQFGTVEILPPVSAR